MENINEDIASIFKKRFNLLVGEDKKKNSIKTDKELAEKIGIKAQSLTYYLKGRLPDTIQLIKISNYFKVSLQYLVGISDNKDYRNYLLGKDFGLSDETKQNLEEYKKDDLMILTINLLLGNKGKELLTTINEYITTPSNNNPYLYSFVDENNNFDEKEYIQIYKIWKMLENLAKDTKKSEAVAEIYYDKAGDIIEEQKNWNGN